MISRFVSGVGAACLWLACGAAPAPAIADVARDVTQCAGIASDADRLACFDEIAGEQANDAASPAPVVVAGGRWVLSQETNADGVRFVVVSLDATPDPNDQFGVRISLVARCSGGVTEAFVNWSYGLRFGNETQPVTLKIGAAKSARQIWALSVDGRSTFLPGSAVAFLKKLASTDKLTVQTKPRNNDTPLTANFDLTGMSEALKPLASACAWPAK
jgi:type VI secretion system protein VasI